MRLIITLLLLLSVIGTYVCDASNTCYLNTDVESCMNDVDVCSWCRSTNQCGQYDSCKQELRIDDTFYECTDIEINEYQQSCIYFENLLLGFCFTITSVLVTVGYIMTYVYWKNRKTNHITIEIISTLFFTLGFLMMISGLGTWIGYNVTKNENLLFASVILFTGFIILFAFVLLIFTIGGSLLIMFAICIGLGSSVAQTCYYKIPCKSNHYIVKIKQTISEIADSTALCCEKSAPMLDDDKYEYVYEGF